MITVEFLIAVLAWVASHVLLPLLTASPMFIALAVQAGQRPQKSMFRLGTRQRFAPVQTGVAWSSAGRQSIQMPRVGFGSAILARLTGTMTLAGAGVLTATGPWDLVSRLVFRTNIGAAVIYSTSGIGNYMVQRLLTNRFDPQMTLVGGLGGTSPDADIFAAGLAMGANTWTLTYWIPLSMNYGKQFQVGLINLQAPELQANLDLEFGTGAGVVSNFTSFTGTVDTAYLFYEVPDPRRVLYPPVVFHRHIQSDQTITTVGDQLYTVPREGWIWRLGHLVYLNDARSNGVSRFTVRFNRTDEIYRIDLWQQKWLQHYRYNPLPTGMFAHDWWDAESVPGEGDNRDAIFSEPISTFESIVTTTGAVGGTLNRLDSLRQFTQVVAGG